ncbi:tetratricopeptide repeat protein [Salibaculum sp.]|uniref:tetratricopeptide repeat protein n=1 Tax=Salibaculum sp. TaxID=2855480 RepID=UPI002B4594AE|nr:tetratricopeptide repeat protein [Salibaculum sp.]HKL70697.1 tetratricopeptide repeat protein [Salibaculum sp.]
MRFLLPLALISGPALADCPAPPDHTAAFDEAIAQLQGSSNEMEAREHNATLWGLWLDAPDERAQTMLDEGMARRESYDFLGSIAVLSRLVDYCPDYAEGYNQRAFSYFVARRYEEARADLERALELNNRHIGALSGMALALIELDRPAEAIPWLRRAVELHPFLAERALLDRLPGEDI